MTAASSYEISAARNVPWAREFEFSDPAGEPFDFTGWTAALQVRLYEGALGAALISLSTASNSSAEGVHFFADDPGRLQVLIKEASLNSLPGLHEVEAGAPQRFFYDLVLTDPSGFEQCFMEGAFVVRPGVTR